MTIGNPRTLDGPPRLRPLVKSSSHIGDAMLLAFFVGLATAIGVADEPKPKVEPPKRIEDVKFEAVHRLPTAEQNTTAMRPFVDEFTIEGRQTDRKVRLPHHVSFAIYDEKMQTYLALGSHRLFVVRPDKEKEAKALFPPYERVIDLEDVLPGASAKGCCLDKATRQLWLTTHVTGGYNLCRYDLERDDWRVVASLGKLDTSSMCFHNQRKTIFALHQGRYLDPKVPELIELSNEGKELRRFPLSQPDLHARLRGGENLPVHLHATDKHVFVFAAQGVRGDEYDRKHRSYILDLDSGAVSVVAH